MENESPSTWGECIRELLDEENLTYREASAMCGRKPDPSTISDWVNHNFIPKDPKMAWNFLSHFPREKAIKCLKIADIPVPEDWIDPIYIIRRSVSDVPTGEKRKKLEELIREIQDDLEKLG
jgi:hypothetical protein